MVQFYQKKKKPLKYNVVNDYSLKKSLFSMMVQSCNV